MVVDVTTAGYKNIRAEFNLTWDGHDKWGSTLEWWFAVATTLYHYDPQRIPGNWAYRHSPLCEYYVEDDTDPCGDLDSYAAAQLNDMLRAGEIDLDDLVAFGEVMTRYANLLREAGNDY